MITLKHRAISAIGLMGLCVGTALELGAEEERFEVASIRPSNLETMSPPLRMGPLTFQERNTLYGFIRLAYSMERYQIVGGPKWSDSDRYDIIAKAGVASTADQIRRMLTTLLRESFHLKVHKASRLMTVYAVTLHQKTAKLRIAPAARGRDLPGAIQVSTTKVVARGASMGLLAHYLTIELGRPVLDLSGLDGSYEFELLLGETKPIEGSADSFGAISHAVRDLGLRIETRKQEVPVVVIDYAEPPGVN